MRNPNLFVLSTTYPVSDEVYAFMLFVAQNLYREGRPSQHFKGETCEGMVSTDFKYGCLGPSVGIVFTANLDIADRSIVTKYLVQASHLDAAVEGWNVSLMLHPKGSLREFEDAPGIH